MGALKILLAVIGLVAMTGCGNAQDMTLRYESADSPEDRLTIEASGGNIRAEDGRGQMIIVRDGESYVVFSPPAGGQAVTRIEDYEAVGAEIRARLLASGAFSDEEDGAYRLEEEGQRTVGAWQGDVYSIGPVEAPGVSMELVISSDPALADARRVATPVFQAFERVSRAILIYPPDFIRLSDETLARGMPLSVSRRALQSIGTDPVPAARFDLPSPALSRDELRARLAQ